MPGTTPLCQEHAIKQEIKQGSRERKNCRSPLAFLKNSFLDVHARTHTRQAGILPWGPGGFPPGAVLPQTLLKANLSRGTVGGDIFKAMTQRSVTHSVFSVGGERVVLCCSCHSAQHYKSALRHYSKKVRQPDPAQRVPADTVRGKGVWGQALPC